MVVGCGELHLELTRTWSTMTIFTTSITRMRYDHMDDVSLHTPHIHTYIHTYIYTYIHTYNVQRFSRISDLCGVRFGSSQLASDDCINMRVNVKSKYLHLGQRITAQVYATEYQSSGGS